MGYGIDRMPFLIIGRAGMDLYADPPGARTEEAAGFSAALGGSAANIAAGIARLGGAASLATTISEDAIGRYTLNQLRAYGIDTRHVRAVGGEARNSLALVETRAENCQSVIYRNCAADFAFNPDDAAAIDFSRFGTVVITGTCFALEPSRSATFSLIEIARKAGKTIVLDLDYRPYSWRSADEARQIYRKAAMLCDCVIGNDDEFAVTAGRDGLAYAAELSRTSARIAIYKRGSLGAITFADGGSIATGIYPVQALKPTGAGDAFLAAFLMGLAEGRSLENAVLRGSAAAAVVVTRVGCAPAMPDAAELDSFIAAQPPLTGKHKAIDHAYPAV